MMNRGRACPLWPSHKEPAKRNSLPVRHGRMRRLWWLREPLLPSGSHNVDVSGELRRLYRMNLTG